MPKRIHLALAKSPCKGCPNRALPPAPDCHNDSCPGWAEFQRKKAAAYAEKLKDDIPNIALAAERIKRKDKFIKSDDR